MAISNNKKNKNDHNLKVKTKYMTDRIKIKNVNGNL